MPALAPEEATAVRRYQPGAGFDEAFAADGRPRALYAPLLRSLAGLDIARLASEVNAHTQRAGVTFGVGACAPFVVDPVPRLLEAAQWRALEAGLTQRARALDAFVCDVYGRECRAIATGVVPERVLAGVPFLERDLRDCPPPPGPRVSIAGLDLVRGAGGEFLVLEDNVRTPSGMGYLLAARRAIEAHVAGAEVPVGVLAPLREQLRGVLHAARAPDDGSGLTVLLSDGPSNCAWYEHRELARLAGVPIVALGDLCVRNEQLRMRANGRRVVSVYRRTDEDRLRGDDGELTAIGSLLLPALRAGTVGMVNGFGAGVADDKRIYPFVDELVRLYLGQEPLIRSVPTYDLGDRSTRAAVLERLDELVVKPRDGHGGAGVLIGPRATAQQLRCVAAAIGAAPEEWVAQEPVRLSTHPTVVNGELSPRHVDLRPFVFFDGINARVLPGGLTRVAIAAGELVVNSSRGGGAKDTWVLR